MKRHWVGVRRHETAHRLDKLDRYKERINILTLPGLQAVSTTMTQLLAAQQQQQQQQQPGQQQQQQQPSNSVQLMPGQLQPALHVLSNAAHALGLPSEQRVLPHQQQVPAEHQQQQQQQQLQPQLSSQLFAGSHHDPQLAKEQQQQQLVGNGDDAVPATAAEVAS
jgi:hypothetical protein